MVSRNTMQRDGTRTNVHHGRYWEGRVVCFLCDKNDLTLYEMQTGDCQNAVGATERAAWTIVNTEN